jgi:hypothetical protein
MSAFSGRGVEPNPKKRLGQKNKKTGHHPLSETVTLCLPNMTDADQLSLPQRPHSL